MDEREPDEACTHAVMACLSQRMPGTPKNMRGEIVQIKWCYVECAVREPLCPEESRDESPQAP